MASKQSDKTERAQRKALRAWVDAVLGATHQLSLGPPQSDKADEIVKIVRWLAMVAGCMVIGEPESPQSVGRLRRIQAAWRPRKDTERMALAHRIIRMHAERSGVMSYLEHATTEHVALFLTAGLSSNVDDAFDRVPQEDVQALVARYTSTKNRRGGKLTAAGILVALNKLAGYPFPRSLTAANVTTALGRHR